jgi:FMN phosphatase YigB (HAD superfamily)/DNA-binding XRE family transcriptional regulator
MDEVDLGKKLQNARKKAGLTQQELCHKAKLSYSTLAKIERGAIKSPSIFTIQSVAAALGTSLSELMGDDKRVAKKRSKSGIRFVYFDINGCLVRFFHPAFAKIAADSGASADVVETTFWHYNDAVCRGELKLEEFNKLFADRLGVKELDWNSYYLDAVEPIDETMELVRWAAPLYRVGLLSNIMPGLVDELFARKMLPDVPFDAIIDSSKVGAIKPEAKIYETAQSWTDCKPEEILLVDDDRSNLMAAEHMGWHVLWFDDYRPEESVARVRDALELEEDSSN